MLPSLGVFGTYAFLTAAWRFSGRGIVKIKGARGSEKGGFRSEMRKNRSVIYVYIYVCVCVFVNINRL